MNAALLSFDLEAATPRERFAVGAELVAVGPAAGTKLGPPERVTVVEVLDDRYRVRGERLVAPSILFAAEHMWTAAPTPATLPVDPQGGVAQ